MIVKDLTELQKPEGKEAGPPIASYSQNDAGIAQAFADRYADRVRFAPGIGWLFWNGNRWERDATGRINQLAVDLSRTALDEVSKIEKEADRRAFFTFANGLGNKSRIANLISLAESNPALVVEAAELDADPWLVGVTNGTLDLRSGRFFTAERGDLITRSLGTRWDETATCPKWKRFLAEVMKGDAELVEYIRRTIGYTLTGETREQAFFFQWGSGANGKSVLSATLETLLGDYCHRASAELFDKRHDRNKGPELAEVAGARLILASETQEGGRLDERLVKDITGGETLRAEAKFCAGFNFRPQGKIWMSGNHKPRITGTDNGIWRRVRLLPFEARFEGDHCNPNLAAELREELPGILRWAVEGCQAWRAEGLGLPERVKAAVEEYRGDEDELGAFIADRIEDAPEAATCPKRAVFAAYESWTAAEGIRHPMTQKQLSRKLKERGWTELYGKYWRGFRIAEEKPEGEED
jgi:putative DNA primase/helicase